ncbi:tetratricopeptide repeat protein [Calidifontibacter sp. DB0510]|uniref:Tetratricopeptide repeat protein n=1 Tax=Metallococcus carri TaxID=1656884 RepID=A0A967E9K9_9MICO|nr:tetratricopeptide repeat protein [Metallococcus carri]NHN54964.1 tetratricopeptide repeat protein [Metallococcus carri]NOP37310.1 tetratricopeptide repeat protein [Calidifontibacter sp. DB2511S]
MEMLMGMSTVESDREAARRLAEESDADPNDAELALQAALTLDKVSREATAVDYYERAIDLGLVEKNELLATACLVSSFRNLHRYDAALARLDIAAARWPQHVALESLRALVLLDSGEPDRAMYTLGQVLIAVTEGELDETYTALLRSKFRGLLHKRRG